MDKKLEQISALFDGELDQQELEKSLANLHTDPALKDTMHQYALISELMQRKAQKSSKVIQLFSHLPKLNPILLNSLTAAATVLITLMAIYQFDAGRFNADPQSTMQLSSAISSDEAKYLLVNADQNIMDHMIHIMQSNQPHDSQAVSRDWVPIGFAPSPQNPHQFTNGRNNLYFHIENKQLGIKKVKYFKANKNWIYLIPLRDGRLLTVYGDVPPDIASKMIKSMNIRK